mgnify:CR=1 FL=1
MSDRLFLLDKNYILKQAQQDLRLELQATLVEKVKEGYFSHFNPLRLQDDTTNLIESYEPVHLSLFDELYDILSGIYRYKIGDNQLELLFDGKGHYETYLLDWKDECLQYVDQLAQKSNFIIACLELSVYYSPDKRVELSQNRLKTCIYDHFGLKIYKYKGLQKYDKALA